MIYEQILAEHQRLTEQIDSLQTQLQDLPDGKFYASIFNKQTGDEFLRPRFDVHILSTKSPE